MKTALLLVILMVSVTALAQDQAPINTYAFGGSCASQGSWTAAAVAQTSVIRGVINSILNDKNCTDLAKNLLNSLELEERQLSGPSGTEPESESMASSQLANDALFNEASSPDSKNKGPLMQTLLNTTMNNSLWKLQSASAIGGLTGLNKMVTASSNSLSTAFGIFSNMAQSLPNYDQCLIGRPSEGATLLAGMIRLGAAFASSGHGLVSQWAETMTKMINMLRNRRLTQALAQLGQTDLWISMSCLLETTTEAYCSAKDGEELLKKTQKMGRQPGQPVFSNNQKVDLDSPLAGYYILTVHLPNVASWLQEIQLSVDPKWSTDAQLRTVALDNVNNFIKSLWTMKGKFREDINTMLKSVPESDLKGRKNSLMAALQNLVSNMGGGGAGIDQSLGFQPGAINFFLQSVQPYEIPFILVGMGEHVPQDVIVNSAGLATQWSNWMMLNDYERVPGFKDPVKLADTIENNMKILIRSALVKASNYYRDRIIINKENVINKTMVSFTYDVRTSLMYIYLYLDNLEKLIKNYSGPQYMLKSLANTKYKILRVLNSYKMLDIVNNLNPEETNPNVLAVYKKRLGIGDIDPNNDTGSVLIEAVYDKILQEAYKQFDVLLQRDGFLTTSLSTFIFEDYVLKVKNHIGTDNYTEDLLVTTGQDLLNFITRLHGINPARAREDLAKAQAANMNNLATLEQVFRDSYYASLERINLTSHGQPQTEQITNLRNVSRMYRDVTNGQAFRENPVTMTWALFKSLLFPPSAPWMALRARELTHPDLYPLSWNNIQNVRPSRDNDNGDYGYVRNILCIQSMAFQDWSFFTPLCTDVDPKTNKRVGVVLQSPQAPTPSQDEYLNAAWDKLAGQGFDQRVCAFRNFNRRNFAYWLTQNLSTIPKPDDIFNSVGRLAHATQK